MHKRLAESIDHFDLPERRKGKESAKIDRDFADFIVVVVQCDSFRGR